MSSVLCYKCKSREASPFLCSHCQWSLVENPEYMKKISKLLQRLERTKNNA